MALKDKTPKEKAVEALVDRGGSITVAVQDEPEIVRLQLRPEVSVVAEIDRILERKPKAVRPSRHAWIMSAIFAQLQREREEQL